MTDDTKRIWDKYERFQVLANRWLEENPKMKRADLALTLGVKPGSLKQYWGGYQVPGRVLLDRMVKVFGVDYSDLRASQDDEPLQDVDNFMLRVMGSDLAKLTERQKQSALEAWRAIVRGYEPPT